VTGGAVVGGFLASTAMAGSATGSDTAAPPTFQVVGYTDAQAASITSKCLTAAYEAEEVPNATLRAAVSESAGSSFIITTATSWAVCNESGGTYRSGLLQNYSTAQGWGQNTSTSGNVSASWLLTPVELDSYGGSLVGTTNADGWMDIAVGRVASNVTKVTIQMPSGATATATVENGFFIAREALPAQPPLPQGTGRFAFTGYDSSGAVIYSSLNSPASPTACFVTPSGQPVSPRSAGQTCQMAVPWDD
jgi:hypothetical protein